MPAIETPPTALLAQTAAPSAAEAGPQPIIVDIGKKSRRDVRKLRQGKPGKLLRRLDATLAHLRDTGELAADAQPIVIVVRQRPSRRNRKLARLWGIG